MGMRRGNHGSSQLPRHLKTTQRPLFPKDKRDGKAHLHFFLLLVSHRNCIPVVFPLLLLLLQFEIFFAANLLISWSKLKGYSFPLVAL